MAKRFTISKKTCPHCNKNKPLAEFYFRWDKPHLYQSHCKECVCLKVKKREARDPVRKKERDKKYHLENRESRLAYLKEWQSQNKHLRYPKERQRRLTDLHFLLRQRLHNRLSAALRRNSKHSATEILLGCTIAEFKSYFESLFRAGMTWDQVVSGEIHIDHKIPCAKFDLSKEEDQKTCFHYTNLQPLYARENILKRDSLEVCHF